MQTAVVSASIACLASACGTTTASSRVRTADLVALIDITAEQPASCVVAADVMVSGNRSNAHVVLEGGDHLHASCGGRPREMRSVDNGSYQATFERFAGECTVALTREVDVPAPHSIGTLPAPFEIVSDFGDQPISRANDTLALRWSPRDGGAEITIELEGDCIHSQEFQVTGDPGVFVIEPGKLAAWEGQEKESCNVAVRVVQLRKGYADPALDHDSSVVLRQIRVTRFVSSP